MATFDDVRAIAMALPEAEEIVTWDTDVTFRVRKKIFAIGATPWKIVGAKKWPRARSPSVARAPPMTSSPSRRPMST